jgi:RNA polymerase sigma-70 factor (ECF subfamily)
MDAKELFEILVREHSAMLLVYLRAAAREPALVDDLFQETMLTAWQTLDRFDRTRPFGPWLRGIAGKLVLAQRRKAVADWHLCGEEMLDHLNDRLTAVHAQPGDTLDEKLAGLRECLDKLPEPYREAVRLRYLEQLSPAGLAERLQISVEALKKRLQRSRARLLECLNRKLAPAEGL